MFWWELERFSALQRAENSSILCARITLGSSDPFQCSSASRKFLNHQRPARHANARVGVSVLFSEPKIPQCTSTAVAATCAASVSVLFSEPKIPQFYIRQRRVAARLFQCSSASRKFLNAQLDAVLFGIVTCFSALQRAENSSIERAPQRNLRSAPFQCSSASRKFLNGAFVIHFPSS